MYAAAGISFPEMSSPTNNKVNIQQTIESAISSVPAFQGANVTVKVLVMENNNGTIHFLNMYMKSSLCVESFMICAILVKYSFKNHEFIVAFSWCIVHCVLCMCIV